MEYILWFQCVCASVYQSAIQFLISMIMINLIFDTMVQLHDLVAIRLSNFNNTMKYNFNNTIKSNITLREEPKNQGGQE